jgi:hypothetical protein
VADQEHPAPHAAAEVLRPARVGGGIEIESRSFVADAHLQDVTPRQKAQADLLAAIEAVAVGQGVHERLAHRQSELEGPGAAEPARTADLLRQPMHGVEVLHATAEHQADFFAGAGGACRPRGAPAAAGRRTPAGRLFPSAIYHG